MNSNRVLSLQLWVDLRLFVTAQEDLTHFFKGIEQKTSFQVSARHTSSQSDPNQGIVGTIVGGQLHPTEKLRRGYDASVVQKHWLPCRGGRYFEGPRIS